MSQSQIDATALFCQLLEQDKPEINGQALHSGENKDAAVHLLRERLLVLGKTKEWVTCPECEVDLARVVREVGGDKIMLMCPQCQDVTGPRHLTDTHKVSMPKFQRSLLNGLDLSANGLSVAAEDQIWRLGTTQASRNKPLTWYFARQLFRPEVAARLREQIALDKTTQSCVVLTTSDVPLPLGSPMTEFDVRPLVTMGRIGQSKFEFFADRQGYPGPQVLAQATAGTSLKYVKSEALAFVDGVRFELEPSQQKILIALIDATDHELEKGALKSACGSQSQDFSPSREFQRNQIVYKTVIHYLRDDDRYALVIPAEDAHWLR